MPRETTFPSAAQVTSDEDGFRIEALAFLESNAEPRLDEKVEWGNGSDSVALFADKTAQEELEDLEVSRSWRRKLFDAGSFIIVPKSVQFA